MGSRTDGLPFLSRRAFLKSIAWTPAGFLVAPLQPFPASSPAFRVRPDSFAFSLEESRLKPHYPNRGLLDDVLRLVDPGLDEFITEKYAFEIEQILNRWSQGLTFAPGGADKVSHFLNSILSPTIAAASLRKFQDDPLRSSFGIEVLHRTFSPGTSLGRDGFAEEMGAHLGSLGQVETAQFQIVGIEEVATPGPVRVEIRYELVGAQLDGGREQRVGLWHTQWLQGAAGWQAVRWETGEEVVSRVRAPWFVDVTEQALGQNESYKKQLRHGADHWRTILDGACGIDIYGNNGVAVGDFDNDGFDDIYVCQASGLPNRLYRNRGDGTFEDVTELSGVGLLDGTACALFADFENKGLQDLLIVCASGPQLFLNEGNGRFRRKENSFRFAQPPQGTFTHAAAADYDGDGRLDVYFCLYSYYLGLDQYHYPAPYFDARNGPPNFLFHNEGGGNFQDRTEAAGMNIENNRYSFACAWGDYEGKGYPSLYVVNDFGRSNLYRNNGDGVFSEVSDEARVNDAGAGMSAAWFDFDTDGKPDLYAANMWSAAGQRVSQQKEFHANEPESMRSFYRGHAMGNFLYRNKGDGKFENASEQTGTEMGRWAWCSDAWDFDHDGYPDVHIANGYISGADRRDLGSFFWRQVVGKSPSSAIPSASYERGWNAINELIRSDLSWSGYERNVLYLNTQDGGYVDVSGSVGLDFLDDSRSFALADLDHDGRLEAVLKNRNAPQLRLVHNTNREIGRSVIFRLRGTKSNRDAIGASVTVESGGHCQTKYVQAGSGFLAQHTKELFFGLGQNDGLEENDIIVRASIRWPSGLTQTFERVPASQRIEIEEGSATFAAKPFAPSPISWNRNGGESQTELLPSTPETWLVEPLRSPDFTLADLEGNLRNLRSFQGRFIFLFFWTTSVAASVHQLRELRDQHNALNSSGIRTLGVIADDGNDLEAIRGFASRENLNFPNLLATSEVAGTYNIIYRYLFDRRRDIPIPTSFLIDAAGMIVKIYQGAVAPKQILKDVGSAPQTPGQRIEKALPFAGVIPEGGFQRNDFTYGVAMFQRGYLEPAADSFQQVIAAKPEAPEAYYNLGTLYLRRNSLIDAKKYLNQALALRSNYPEAWNNLGMIAAEQGQAEESINYFKKSLLLQPKYGVALVNLGNLYRRQGNYVEAEALLRQALAVDPTDPEANYNIGMLYARQENFEQALESLQRAVNFRPDYADARNNIGVIFVRQKRFAEAEEEFKTCIRVAPGFDQAYMNLARLYAVLKNDSQAREVLNSLLRARPGDAMARKALEMLH